MILQPSAIGETDERARNFKELELSCALISTKPLRGKTQ